MKNFTRLKLAAVALSLAFLSSCSSNLYTFAPGTGSYHNPEKKAVASAPKEEAAPENISLQAATATEPAEIQTAPARAAAALSQVIAVKRSAEKEHNTVSGTEKKGAKAQVKQVRQELKALKKKVKETDRSGSNATIKLLLILGLAFLLLGILLNLGILYTIGVVLLIIGLVLLLMEVL